MYLCYVRVGSESYTDEFASTCDAVVDAMRRYPNLTSVIVRVLS